jgi:hypothetical protein
MCELWRGFSNQRGGLALQISLEIDGQRPAAAMASSTGTGPAAGASLRWTAATTGPSARRSRCSPRSALRLRRPHHLTRFALGGSSRLPGGDFRSDSLVRYRWLRARDLNLTAQLAPVGFLRNDVQYLPRQTPGQSTTQVILRFQ